jgi:hypothetical protein
VFGDFPASAETGLESRGILASKSAAGDGDRTGSSGFVAPATAAAGRAASAIEVDCTLGAGARPFFLSGVTVVRDLSAALLAPALADCDSSGARGLAATESVRLFSAGAVAAAPAAGSSAEGAVTGATECVARASSSFASGPSLPDRIAITDTVLNTSTAATAIHARDMVNRAGVAPACDVCDGAGITPPGTASSAIRMRDDAATNPRASATAAAHSAQLAMCASTASRSEEGSSPSSHA